MTKVDVLVFDGVDDLDVVGPLEVLDLSRRAGSGVVARLVALEPGPGVHTRAGLTLGPVHRWEPGEADVVLVPGGGFAGGAATGVRAEIESGRLPGALRAAERPGLVFASVCTGALLLAAAGLLDGRPCTTHHLALAELEAAGGRVVPGRVVDDGDRVTSGGVTSGLDLGLHLVERYAGAETAAGVARVMEHERRDAPASAGDGVSPR
ncbi:DJ-1/PfpI family protein [Umezawaea beigongshangensis]|uniref:DJ-1/PfpI family protein n=1 Tax=Umezawaea beigongshangensis TaxID=2780383 RepID=UPI0018F1D010|nr:DJ-1/PfpI family protein [Umezawaea beigongshangensis]